MSLMTGAGWPASSWNNHRGRSEFFYWQISEFKIHTLLGRITLLVVIWVAEKGLCCCAAPEGAGEINVMRKIKEMSGNNAMLRRRGGRGGGANSGYSPTQDGSCPRERGKIGTHSPFSSFLFSYLKTNKCKQCEWMQNRNTSYIFMFSILLFRMDPTRDQGNSCSEKQSISNFAFLYLSP